jgi:hypothetical protein
VLQVTPELSGLEELELIRSCRYDLYKYLSSPNDSPDDVKKVYSTITYSIAQIRSAI